VIDTGQVALATEGAGVGEMSIGEFASRSRLSQKALRLYDEQGLLRPARVDPGSGYRYYSEDQLDRARMVSLLRRIGTPLAEVSEILALDQVDGAERVLQFWSRSDQEHTERRWLANHVVELMSGKSSAMYEVKTREMPDRKVLCVKRNIGDQAAVWAFGKEFIGILKRESIPRIDGVVGAAFCILHGEVSEDSDGPIEWCIPVHDEDAEKLSASIPELSLRTERAHEEAYVHLDLGPNGEWDPARDQLMSESFRSWTDSRQLQINELGIRLTYLFRIPVTDCDFAVPLEPRSA
jgi:DNA-binding transcriptional MerR regulator